MGNELKLKKTTSDYIFAADIRKSSLVCAGGRGGGRVHGISCLITDYGYSF